MTVDASVNVFCAVGAHVECYAWPPDCACDCHKRYRIVRFYADDLFGRRVLSQGLTLEEVQAHCNDPQHSSQTATWPEGVAHTRVFGDWFDGYEEITE